MEQQHAVAARSHAGISTDIFGCRDVGVHSVSPHRIRSTRDPTTRRVTHFLWSVVLSRFQIAAWKVSHGVLWSSQAPAALAELARTGNGGIVAAKAIVAAMIAAFPAWYVSRGALEPMDAHRHIRGGRLYRGGDAMKKLAKQLGSGK